MPYNFGGYPAPSPYAPPMLDQLAQLRQYQFAPPPAPGSALGSTFSSDMIWVLNETEATSYPVAPNNNVTLWDKSKPVIYIKSANAQGVPSIRILDYKERIADNGSNYAPNASEAQGGEFVRLDSFKSLQREFEALRDELDDLKGKTKPKSARIAREDKDAE